MLSKTNIAFSPYTAVTIKAITKFSVSRLCNIPPEKNKENKDN